MIIKFSPVRTDDKLDLIKFGNSLSINGELFDFSRMVDGDTLPRDAIKSQWFHGDVEMNEGQLSVLIMLPNPYNYSPEQAFPVPMNDVPDGEVILPKPLPALQEEVLQAQEGEA
ncbi:hypothetical protein [Pseudomonas savastanoi]|uniref:hypothetical protein n=1 Tax=Pseudomonas savastanoi TaxID=29438 RepID=UPI0017855AE9|nr:hypothetical protein [Pseudomonas savastanoi]QOI04620.1 hypothetical protein D5S10_12490 [Pseudomonas savastanoi]